MFMINIQCTVDGCCLAPSEQCFSFIMARTSYISKWPCTRPTRL